MKNILLPTDFSKCSSNAIWYAIHLFKGTSCTFHFLSIYKATNYTSGDLMQASAGDSLHDILISESRSKLEKLISKAEEICVNEDFKFTAITDYDVFTDSINKFLISEKIDLIVMGTDGISGTSEKLFGTHTLRVIRKVKSPLLIIPEHAQFHRLKRLLLSLDPSTDLDQANLQPLLELIGNHSFSLEILRLTNPKEGAEDKKAEEKEFKRLFSIYNPGYHIVKEVSFPQAISTVVQTMNIDMNILPVKKEEFLERLFGSALAKIIYSTTVPLFILHSRE